MRHSLFCGVKAVFSYLLIALVLLQTCSREVLLVEFALRRTELTARFCVNKTRPRLHCNGSCYFAKLARKQEQRQSQSAGPLKERLEMLPAAFRSLVPAAPAHWAGSGVGYARIGATWVPTRTARGVFHPPQG